MNILELDSYNLADAVKFNKTLNPKIWAGETMRPEVREKLLAIAEDFKEFLGLSDIEIKDITVSGSNANYSYTPYSDIDLHLVVDLPKADSDEVYRELFDAKKYQYNDLHNFKIGNYDVELYVENANEPPISKGVYSILNGDWINIPRKVRSEVDDDAVRSKYEDLSHRIDNALSSKDFDTIETLAKKIKAYRQSGLDAHGELGAENLAFKMLRTQGKIKALYDAQNAAKDQELSLKEKAPVARLTWGFKTPTVAEDVGMSWDGVSPTTKMFLSEQEPTDEQILKDFIEFCVKELKIESMPVIKLRRDPQWSVRNRTFGRYIDGEHMLEVAFGQRHIMDVLRTVAHELTHKHQHERENVPSDAGETGSRYENEANARAGILMRDYGRLHPELFDAGQADDLKIDESASGYIPTKKQAKDPRWSMALTQDIRPGQLGKEANKLKLKTDSQGAPQIANPNGLFEKLALELNQFKRKGTLAESVQLDEVSMRPSSLMQFANSEEAKGMQAGFEAELIFRDTTSDENDGGGDMEPDYDMDERCRSIQGIIDFFQDGDYGGMSSRQENALREGLDEQYMEWQDQAMYEDWADERDDLIKEAWLRDKPMDERIHAALVDGMELSDEEADAVQQLASDREAGKIKGSDMTEEQLEMVSQYSEAKSIAEDILQEDVEQTIAKEDGFYDEVLDDFRSNFYTDDDSGFFSDVGLVYMSDVASEYDLDWPYLTGGGNDGTRTWDEIGSSLQDTIDMPVKVSSGYHSATRKPGLWIVEPDSSLDPDDREDYGLEIVSPPMPLAQALEKLQEVVEWANDMSEGNAYTNSSTGLHMGISVPFKGGDVDYLKLILFLGDEYVLKQYGREANTYTKAAMKEIKNRAGTEKNSSAVLELLKHNLIELAQRELAKSTGEGKYTSAHKQGKYIEFRSAGGDWLADTDPMLGEAVGAPQGIDKLQSTMMRYAYAMYLASRPDLERREYAKKLYKLVAPEGNDNAMALFSQYAAGELDKDQLKKRWAEKTLSKEAPAEVSKGNWKLFLKDRNTGSWIPVEGQEYNNYTRAEAMELVKKKLSPASSQTDFDKSFNEKYELRDVGTNSGQWRVYRKDSGETLEIIDAPTRGEAVDQAYDTYTNVIPFSVEAYNTNKLAKELSPRAKLAKRITAPVPDVQWEIYNKKTGDVYEKFMSSPKGVSQEVSQAVRSFALNQNLDAADLSVRISADQPEQEPEQTVDNYRGKWEFFYAPTGRVLDAVTDATAPQARAVLADTQRRYNDLPADQIQMRKADAEQEPNVGQNFSTNPNPTVQEPNQVRMPNGVPVWEVYERAGGNVVHVIADHTQREAHQRAQTWLQGVGVEDPSLFAVRAKILQPGERNLSAPLDATEVPRNWEFVNRITGRVVDTMANTSYNNANIWQAALERSNPDADIYLRSVDNLEENFADGKGPGRPGDSQRHGIPKGATIAELEKAAKAPGRKGQLARWQLNMRRGKKK